MYSRLESFFQTLLPHIQQTEIASIQYLKQDCLEVYNLVDRAYNVYQVMLIPVVGNRPFGLTKCLGQGIPFFEVRQEMDTSLLLALSGEYRGAFQHLRFILELACFGIYLLKPAEEKYLKNWIIGERTPAMRDMLGEISKDLTSFEKITELDVLGRVRDLYDELSKYIHTRGYGSTSIGLRGASIPLLDPKPLVEWGRVFYSLIEIVGILMVSKFPNMLLGAGPIFQKMGFLKAPYRLLDSQEANQLRELFQPEVGEKLLSYCRSIFPDQHDHIKTVQILPDLSKEELEKSLLDYAKCLKTTDRGEIPGRTWYSNVLVGNSLEDAGKKSLITEQESNYETLLWGGINFCRQQELLGEMILADVYAQDAMKEKKFLKLVDSRHIRDLSFSQPQIIAWLDNNSMVEWEENEKGLPYCEANWVVETGLEKLRLPVIRLYSDGRLELLLDPYRKAGGEKLVRELRSLINNHAGLSKKNAFYEDQFIVIQVGKTLRAEYVILELLKKLCEWKNLLSLPKREKESPFQDCESNKFHQSIIYF